MEQHETAFGVVNTGQPLWPGDRVDGPEPTLYTAPPTYETLKKLWLGAAPTSNATERWDRRVNFEIWAEEHGIYPED